MAGEAVKDTFAQGRLTSDELDVRVGRALAARTGAEPTALTADIPAERLLCLFAQLRCVVWLTAGLGVGTKSRRWISAKLKAAEMRAVPAPAQLGRLPGLGKLVVRLVCCHASPSAASSFMASRNWVSASGPRTSSRGG